MDPHVVETVRLVLEELRPANVDNPAVTVTGEGHEVEIVIVPHRDLGGVSLVLWTDKNATQLLWAGIGDLSTHDDIDLGAVVTRIPHEGDWPAKLRDAVTAELHRPIRLNSKRGLFGRPRIDCYVTVAGKDKRLAVLRPQSSHRRNDPQRARVAITSLDGGAPLSFSVPPSREEWRRHLASGDGGSRR
jgi:hypothetical protein